MRLKAFCMDVHISVIADFKIACPFIEVIDWCMSGHHWVMKRNKDVPNHINHITWQSINYQMIEEFQKEYGSFLEQFDMFIVAHASVFAMVFEKYKKPIVMINSCRFDLPFCWSKDMKMRKNHIECLQRMYSSGQLKVVCNNYADQAYLKAGTGISACVIPSLCLYTRAKYNPMTDKFILYHGTPIQHNLISQKPSGYHEWQTIANYRGLISFPYEISLMSLFEYFSAGMPMFFPSKSYWKANPNIQSIGAYWGEGNLPEELKELEDKSKWIDMADMYLTFQSPNTYYFDSIPHLIQLLETFQYKDDTEFRNAYIERNLGKWRYLLKYPSHLCYNRLPLLANIVYDVNYTNSGVSPQHEYPYKQNFANGDVVFVKTDLLEWFLSNRVINNPITLITGVSDITPEQCDRIIDNPNILQWIGCNIPVSHPKIKKVLIGVGEPERMNGNHETLKKLHHSRKLWEDKKDEICVPFHGNTHKSRIIEPTLPNLPFEEYMSAMNEYRFVICMRGNGLDTHRFSEILLMGSVPIVETSPLDDLYSQFPCMIVDSFDTIDTSTFEWNDAKYQNFLDMFWIYVHVDGLINL
jgi:hypothetical protein